jgi:predicted CXXCH cytochrome family protein
LNIANPAAMTIEWLLFVILLGSALSAVWKFHRADRRLSLLALALIATFLAGAFLWHKRTQHRLALRQQLVTANPHLGRSDDYVSSDKCQACHAKEYDSWHRSYHRTMTQVAGAKTVQGNFRNVSLELGEDLFRLDQRGEEFWVEMPDPIWALQKNAPPGQKPPQVRRRVGLLTGSHHMQVCWVPSGYGNLQVVVPFAWLIADQRWVPFHQTFLRDPAIAPFPQFWNSTCINCHSTGPLPRTEKNAALVDTRVGEFGIACESCHGPGEEHVRVNRDPLTRYRHRFAGMDPSIVNPQKLSPKRSSQICGQCHGIKWVSNRLDWSQNGFRYRPGHDLDATDPIIRPAQAKDQPWVTHGLKADPQFVVQRYWPDGMVRVSGREYNGLVESPCHQRGELSCLSCHSMHQSKPDDQLAIGMESNQACLQCHSEFASRLEAHTHHRRHSSGSLCYNCHMPHTTYGLLKAIRSHQIDSPNVQTSKATARPNACNLCHLDRTLAWTAQHLSQWYGQLSPARMDAEDKELSAALVWLLKGDAGQRALAAWSMGWEPARQISGEDWLAPYLGQLLEDPYSAVRYIAHRSMRQLAGFENFPFDFTSGKAEQQRARQAALDLWRQARSDMAPRQNFSALLLEANGALNHMAVTRLLQQRDNRSIDLQE